MDKFSELTEAIGGTVDATAGIVRGVRILGRVSKNGRRYSDKALESAAKLYAGRKVNVNHLREGKAERPFQDLFGEIKNASIAGDAVVGDLHFLTEHSLAKSFIEAAEKFPKSFGLSHHAEGTTKREGKDTIVEDVTAVHSVDLVSDPATNSGLFEAVAPQYAEQPADMSGDDMAMADAAVGTLLQAALKTSKSREDFIDKCGKLYDIQHGESSEEQPGEEGEPEGDDKGEAKPGKKFPPKETKESVMEPEEIKAIITEQTKPLTDKVALLESTNASQALKIRCLEKGIEPSAALLESFKDKDEAFIATKLNEMAKEIPASRKPTNAPANNSGGNYERVRKELGLVKS